MKIISALLLLLSLSVAALAATTECTSDDLLKVNCATAASTESECGSISTCKWCASPVANIPKCTGKSGKCECVAGSTSTSAGGACLNNDGPTCTYTVKGSNITEGETCTTGFTTTFTKGSCPKTSSSSSLIAAATLVSAALLSVFLY